MIIDTHCHLDFPEFNTDREAVINRAKESGVLYMINVASNLKGSRESVKLSSEYDNIFASVGIHPHHADEVNEDALDEITTLLKNKKVVAIGEVGLDYFKSPSSRQNQKKVFVDFINIAKEYQLPLIIHNRESFPDTLDIIKTECTFPVKGVMHCFSGDESALSNVLDLGLSVSFTCNLTFKNASKLREVVKFVPKDRLLLETDAPFLAPQKYRGKRNEPSYIAELRNILAELFGIQGEEIESMTTANAKKLFNLPI
jgi:TatD DNase family protein